MEARDSLRATQACQSRAASSQSIEEEWRIDGTDGEKYGIGSFIEVYGGSKERPPQEWVNAKRVVAEAPSHIHSPPQPQPQRVTSQKPAEAELRVDITDGQCYSLESFVEAYGGSKKQPPHEWVNAPKKAAPQKAAPQKAPPKKAATPVKKAATPIKAVAQKAVPAKVPKKTAPQNAPPLTSTPKMHARSVTVTTINNADTAEECIEPLTMTVGAKKLLQPVWKKRANETATKHIKLLKQYSSSPTTVLLVIVHGISVCEKQ